MPAGSWDRHYADLDEAAPYGDTLTYELAAEWVADCELVEDWGCGKGWLRTLIEPERYRGIDGSRTPFADQVVDLATHQSETPGLVMRHVLEHDERWEAILINALASFTERMALVLFTPLQEETRVLSWEPGYGVPNIGFALDDLTGPMDERGIEWEAESVGTETIIRCAR